MIETLRSMFPDAGDVVSFAAGMLKQQRAEMLRQGQPWEPFNLGDPSSPLPVGLKAYVNAANLGGRKQWQGRWIVRCPSAGCGGAEYVDFDRPVFMCCSCWNVAYEHEWLTVDIPTPARCDQIASILAKRPGRFRHWLNGESLAQLRRENRDHGFEE